MLERRARFGERLGQAVQRLLEARVRRVREAVLGGVGEHARSRPRRAALAAARAASRCGVERGAALLELARERGVALVGVALDSAGSDARSWLEGAGAALQLGEFLVDARVGLREPGEF